MFQMDVASYPFIIRFGRAGVEIFFAEVFQTSNLVIALPIVVKLLLVELKKCSPGPQLTCVFPFLCLSLSLFLHLI